MERLSSSFTACDPTWPSSLRLSWGTSGWLGRGWRSHRARRGWRSQRAWRITILYPAASHWWESKKIYNFHQLSNKEIDRRHHHAFREQSPARKNIRNPGTIAGDHSFGKLNLQQWMCFFLITWFQPIWSLFVKMENRPEVGSEKRKWNAVMKPPPPKRARTLRISIHPFFRNLASTNFHTQKTGWEKKKHHSATSPEFHMSHTNFLQVQVYHNLSHLFTQKRTCFFLSPVSFRRHFPPWDWRMQWLAQ